MFSYNICHKFLSIKSKVKKELFVGPQISKLTYNQTFDSTMTNWELEAWSAMKSVIERFLGNTKDANYKTLVENMLEKMRALGCHMTIKITFLALAFRVFSCISWSSFRRARWMVPSNRRYGTNLSRQMECKLDWWLLLDVKRGNEIRSRLSITLNN